MKRQLIICTFFFTIFLTSCEQTKSDNRSQQKQDSIIKVDTTKIAILQFDTTQYLDFKDCKPTELTADDIQKIETLLSDCITNNNSDRNRLTDIEDLKRYKRQYVAVINSTGEKEVWVNCFCDASNKDWKNEIIEVLDGGNCYFNLKINLTKGQCYDLMINGFA